MCDANEMSCVLIHSFTISIDSLATIALIISDPHRMRHFATIGNALRFEEVHAMIPLVSNKYATYMIYASIILLFQCVNVCVCVKYTLRRVWPMNFFLEAYPTAPTPFTSTCFFNFSTTHVEKLQRNLSLVFDFANTILLYISADLIG